MIETFKQRDFVRFDLNLFGYALYGVGRMRSYHSGFGRVAWTYFINRYRWAPVSFPWLNKAGVIERGYAFTPPRLAWTGSVVAPRASWYLRVGRLFVGGDTPRWLQRRMADRVLRRYYRESL